MSLHIVLGFDSPKSSAEPTVVYAGRSGSAARAAMEKSTSQTFGLITNPLILRKNNANAAANRAALDPEAQRAKALADEQARLEAEGNAAKLREDARLKAIALAEAQGVSAAAVDVVLKAIADVALKVADSEDAETITSGNTMGEGSLISLDEKPAEQPTLPLAPAAEPAPAPAAEAAPAAEQPAAAAETPTAEAAPESGEVAEEPAKHFAPQPRRKRQT